MQPTPELICSADKQAIDRAGRPLLRLPEQWRGLQLGVFPIAAEAEGGPAAVASPLLVLATHGQGHRWYRFGTRTLALRTAPGMLDLYGSGFQRDAARWLGHAGRTVGVMLEPQAICRLAPELSYFDIRTTHEVFDPKLQWLVQEMADEAERDAPGGALYAEGLSCALIGRLVEHYGAGRPAKPPPGQFSPLGRRRLVTYIDAHLGSDLSVTALAGEVGLSPRQFAHCFKASFGLPPHQYVLQQRVNAAKRLLRAGSLSIAEIALSLGFSSQSHFSQVFRAHTSMTPAAARLS